MTSVTALANELESRVYLQRTEAEFTADEYIQLIVHAIRRLYVDTGRALKFEEYQFTTETVDDTTTVYFSEDLKVDEEEYVLLIAEIAFLKIIQKDVNVITSYTTNALSVTGADKPYAHLADSIEKLDNERRELLYRMIRYMIGVSY